MNIKIDLFENDRVIEVFVHGEIDAYTAPELRDILFPLSKKDEVQMVVDLTNVNYMDSTGLGVFVGIFKNIRAQSGELRLMGLSDRLKRLFEITGLADIMDINSPIEGEVE
ncbi:STAS domain-containing protein [Robertmurraya yapensis]|uniref:Anti-sigma factor antagonist n=2 Tax=Bacillaceae TaxID=186817 RepID=A0A3S0KDQ9_9BACI|nr:anti-sigma factor antagonist [Bacillus yapensis]RTR28496.1 STAS domain-containing protein [Bacillus yapensis]TKS94557.1 STAS domain-containing protein [Bacillus yapensis]